jgi:hypothetical protein
MMRAWSVRPNCPACCPGGLRAQRNFFSRIKLIWAVQPPLQKYSASHLTQITSRSMAVSSHRGALAIVTDAGRDVVDADGAADESAGLRTEKSCGPDTPALVSSWRRQFRLRRCQQADHRGEHEGNR